jgi:predicted AAA+ superfamily ATPase
LPQLNVVYTGSSILDLERGGADLSRRKLSYTLYGMSFREYVNMSQGLSLPAYPLQEILDGRVERLLDEEIGLNLFKFI